MSQITLSFSLDPTKKEDQDLMNLLFSHFQNRTVQTEQKDDKKRKREDTKPDNIKKPKIEEGPDDYKTPKHFVKDLHLKLREGKIPFCDCDLPMTIAKTKDNSKWYAGCNNRDCSKKSNQCGAWSLMSFKDVPQDWFEKTK